MKTCKNILKKSIFLLFVIFVLNISVFAEKKFNHYIKSTYNSKNGLNIGTANAIVKTDDGVLWLGTYAGLYRYTGKDFKWMKEFKSVKTVNCLFTDKKSRLWIGTNGEGISICENEKITQVFTKKDGLSSNSIRCITESNDGLFYVGTSDNLAILEFIDGKLTLKAEIPEISYANSISSSKNGIIAVTTNAGELFILRNQTILEKKFKKSKYNCCSFSENSKLYTGNSKNNIEIFNISNNKLVSEKNLNLDSLNRINSISFLKNEGFFVCSDTGAGFFDLEENFSLIDTENFNSSIEHVEVDYQGNIWFTSSRLGLLSLSKSVFTEWDGFYKKTKNIVNSVEEFNGILFVGTDIGLDFINSSEITAELENFVKSFSKIRIRFLHKDSKNNLWICTSNDGLFKISSDYKITHFSEKNGTLGNSFRTLIELKNGTIVAAGNLGITYIHNEKVEFTIGKDDGLVNPKILTLCSTDEKINSENEIIFAGTDGNGIAKIVNKKVEKIFSQDDGLSSEVILRIVKNSSKNELFIVTGNGICYSENLDKFKNIENFPYYNNFDLIQGNNQKIFVLSSAGVFVVNESELLNGEKLNYFLLDEKKGLRKKITPNSWTYIDENNNLYLCGNSGITSFNMNNFDNSANLYKLIFNSYSIDGKIISVASDKSIKIDKNAKKIEFMPEILNYSVDDPVISYKLEGFDSDETENFYSHFSSIVYTNLPAGIYNLNISILNARNRNVIYKSNFLIQKEKKFYDSVWFKIFFYVVIAVLVWFITWIILKKYLKRTKLELELANKTILTIAKTVDAKDENTSQHSERVSEYSVLIAKKLGFSNEQCENLRKIALLHDIGKIAIPDKVLNKPSQLTDKEYEIMKSHVLRGAEILKNFTVIDDVYVGALYHHERWDGTGYLKGLKGEEIPLNARIIGISDAFDAMTQNRVYRKKLDLSYTISELKRCSGTQFDPKLVDILLKLIESGEIKV